MVQSSKSLSIKASRPRTDGRKSLLTYMDANLIKELKKAALDDEVNAYEIVETATKEWLARRETKKR